MTSQSQILDTHCHISAYDDPVSVLKAAEAANVSVIAVTGDPGEFRRLKTRLGPQTTVEVAIGLHPLRAATFTPNDLGRFFRLLPQSRWIGEVGLDFSRVGLSTKKEQLRVFDTVLTEAQPGRHPLSVHSRGAEKEVIERLAEAKLPAVLHWYSGPLSNIPRAVEAGLYFSINPAMAASKRFPQLMRAIPSDRILLETDGPFAKTSGRLAMPSDLPRTVSEIAARWGVDADVARATILSNQQRLQAMSAGI